MSRALALGALLAAVFGLPAAAAPLPRAERSSPLRWGELPFRAVGGAAACLRATGLPGELARWTREGVELSSPGTGLTPVALGPVRECPVFASAPTGFTAVAAATATGVTVAVREPAGAWSAPASFATPRAEGVRVAVSARGDVLVAWLGRERQDGGASLAYTVRRAPGGGFGARERVGGSTESPELAVGLADDGAAVLAIAGPADLRLATAVRGAGFSALRELGKTQAYGAGVALAVAGDGRALLAAGSASGLLVFDRQAGADFVRRPAVPMAPAGELGVAVALAGDGGALVAADSGDRLLLVRRAPGGAFGEPETILPPEGNRQSGSAIVSFSYGDGPPFEDRPPTRVLLGAGARALVTWSTADLAAFATTVQPGPGPATVRVGTPLRDPQGLTPLLLADGSRAVAWTDNAAVRSNRAFAGRVHVAVEGAAEAPSAPPPTVTIGAPEDRSLRPAQSLVLPVRCNAACDVRIETGERVFDPGASRSRAGTTRLRLFPLGRPLAPARLGPVRLRLIWSAPGSRAVARRTVSVRLRRAPAPPFPRLRDVRATRGPGGVVDVRWSTDVPARDVGFLVVGDVRRSERVPDDGISDGQVNGDGKRRFHVKLTKAGRVRYVRVEAVEYFGHHRRRTTVAVR